MGGLGLQFDSIFQLIFSLLFMVVVVTAISIVFSIIAIPFSALGKFAQSLIERMRTQQFAQQSAQAKIDARLERLFPRSKAPMPDWVEVRAEVVAGGGLVELWTDYHSGGRGSYSQAAFGDHYEAWRRDAPAQLAALDALERSWGAERDTRLVTAYVDALAALKRNGDTVKWVQTQLRLGEAAVARDGPLRAMAVPAYESALSELTPERHPVEWVRAQHGLGTVPGDHSRAARAFGQALAVLAKSYQRGDLANKLSWICIKLDQAYALLQVGRAGNAPAAVAAECAYDEALSMLEATHDPERFGRAKLNLANAVETQGDCAAGTAALGHYQRARALYQSALAFWAEQKLSKYKRMSRNLERLDDKVRRA